MQLSQGSTQTLFYDSHEHQMCRSGKPLVRMHGGVYKHLPCPSVSLGGETPNRNAKMCFPEDISIRNVHRSIPLNFLNAHNKGTC